LSSVVRRRRASGRGGARQLQVLAQAVSVWQACDHHGPGPGQPHPAAGEVLFDGSVVGPTNIPIAVLAEQRRVRVHDPDNGIGWDIIVTTASVPTALETSLDLG
jgi:hypothetical protein